MIYIGNTQQHPKKRMQGHAQDCRKMILSGTKSDSFAEHFCQFIPIPKEGEKLKVQDYMNYDFEILWKGNPINAVKSFGKRSCKLCAQERLAILKATRKDPNIVINNNNEIYGACRHKPWFHRYPKRQNTAGTDESYKKDERVEAPNSTSSADSSVSVFLFGNQITEDEIREKDPPAALAAGRETLQATNATGGPFTDLTNREFHAW